MPLNYFVIGNPKTAIKRFFVCHGIFGSSRNWRSFVYKLSKDCPTYCFFVVDLRCHGQSHQQKPPHTLRSCAQDLLDLERQEGEMDGVIGHSFGGKVALCYGRLTENKMIWVLDSPPGGQSDAQRGEAQQVLQALQRVPLPLQKRKDVAVHLSKMGFSVMLSQWMTTNVKPAQGGYVWRFDLAGIEQLLNDYFQQDYWSFLENPPSSLDIHVVRAADSDRWQSAQLARLSRLTKTQVYLLPNAGHWLHVDNPKGLMGLLRKRL